MIEIRPIREYEAERFLKLLCTVFDLDLARAYDVFFAEPLYDLNRKWALFDGEELVSILTTTPLIFGWGRAFGIAGMATRQDRQGRGYGSRLLQEVLRVSEQGGEHAALLFARHTGFYERNGFSVLDHVIRAPVIALEHHNDPVIEDEDVQLIYDAWASQHPDRLRRDAKRWAYWKWNYRVSTSLDEGYLCHEPGLLRECISYRHHPTLPLPPDTEWFGLTSVAHSMHLPLGPAAFELYFMGRGAQGLPQLFMTDQF